MRRTALVLALEFAGGPLAAQLPLDTAALRALRPQVVQSGPRTSLRSMGPNIVPLRNPDAWAGPPDSAMRARARAVLRHDLFALAGWPIVSVEVRPCPPPPPNWRLHWSPADPPCLNDTVVVVQQRQDTVTLELTEGFSAWIAFEGPVERCREMRRNYRDYRTQLAGLDCGSPRPYQTIEHVWLVLRGPLPHRARGELLDHLVQFTWSPARLRPN